MTSWVETRCPPGWSVSMMAHNHERPERVWWARTVGCAAYGETRRHACRLAWERWAMEVLGGRVQWGEEADPTIWVEGSHWTAICRPHPVGWEIATTSDGKTTGEHFVSDDSLEAIVRLAALTMAVLGPEARDD